MLSIILSNSDKVSLSPFSSCSKISSTSLTSCVSLSICANCSLSYSSATSFSICSRHFSCSKSCGISASSSFGFTTTPLLLRLLLNCFLLSFVLSSSPVALPSLSFMRSLVFRPSSNSAFQLFITSCGSPLNSSNTLSQASVKSASSYFSRSWSVKLSHNCLGKETAVFSLSFPVDNLLFGLPNLNRNCPMFDTFLTFPSNAFLKSSVFNLSPFKSEDIIILRGLSICSPSVISFPAWATVLGVLMGCLLAPPLLLSSTGFLSVLLAVSTSPVSVTTPVGSGCSVCPFSLVVSLACSFIGETICCLFSSCCIFAFSCATSSAVGVLRVAATSGFSTSIFAISSSLCCSEIGINNELIFISSVASPSLNVVAIVLPSPSVSITDLFDKLTEIYPPLLVLNVMSFTTFCALFKSTFSAKPSIVFSLSPSSFTD